MGLRVQEEERASEQQGQESGTLGVPLWASILGGLSSSLQFQACVRACTCVRVRVYVHACVCVRVELSELQGHLQRRGNSQGVRAV